MMGVMPALADPTASVPLTVEVVPIVSISVPTDTVDFGTPRPGEAPTATITITNDGDVDVTVVASVTPTEGFFDTNLAITGTYASILEDATGDADLTLTIPGDAIGEYTGSILFTATEGTG